MKTKQSGITMIEVMVALALSLIILAGVMHIFINNKQTYRVQQAFARLQESGRFATHFITKDLRMAGYAGCGSKINNPVNMTDLDGDGNPDIVGKFTTSGIEGFQSTDLPIPLTDTVNLTSSDVVAGTDIVRIKRATSTGVRLKGNLATKDAQIQLDASTAAGVFQDNDYLFISDCEAADIFVANNVSSSGTTTTIAHPNSVNMDHFLSKRYQDDAEVYKFISTTYYLGYNNAGEVALFRQTLGNAATMNVEELVEGVEDMHLLYGEDSDGDGTPNRYVDSATVGNWNNIVSVRIELTVRSLEDHLSAKMTAYGDHKLRRTFTTSIAIRNNVT
ncbi:MAG: PilW family protein [Gammaproteobacteria bacterium]|jgi:type IV pilus assembly protein PilW